MNCNEDMHDELKNIGESACPFCEQLLIEGDKVADICCGDQNIEHNNGMNVCLNCGSVHGYNTTEYIDYYENIYKINRKSV